MKKRNLQYTVFGVVTLQHKGAIVSSVFLAFLELQNVPLRSILANSGAYQFQEKFETHNFDAPSKIQMTI